MEAAKKWNVKKNGKSPKGGGAGTKIKKTTIYNVDYFQMRGDGVKIFWFFLYSNDWNIGMSVDITVIDTAQKEIVKTPTQPQLNLT